MAGLITMKQFDAGALRIAANLSVPLDAVTQALAFLGRRGTGKSYASTKLAELMHDAGAQFVAIDPVGIWYGLRQAGSGPGLDIPIFGGLHGDIPLEPTGGALVADVIVDRTLSAVIDVSQFESDADRARFALDFAARFFYRKKSSPSAVHVFVEEAQEFVPQNPQKGEERMLHAWQRMMRLGRNYGIGMSLISQRPQDVNKKALNQAECVFAFQLTGPQERKAVEGWISDKGLDVALSRVLPDLEQGHAHVWSPVWLKFNQEVTIARKRTFAAGGTPAVGGKVDSKPLQPIDLQNLRESMADTIERAKAEDPKELRRQLAERDRRIRELEHATSRVVNDPEAITNAFRDGADSVRVQLARAVADYLDEVKKSWVAALAGVEQSFEEAIEKATDGLELPEFPGIKDLMAPPASGKMRATARGFVADKQHVDRMFKTFVGYATKQGGDGSLSAPERRILTVLAQRPDIDNLDRLAVLAGYTVNGHFNNILGGLRSKGYVTPARVVPIQITPEGSRALGGFEPLPTGEALQNYWLNRLTEPEGRILSVLLKRRGRPIELEELAREAGYTINGHFNNIVGSLRTKGLMSPARTPIRAAEEFFE